MKRPIGIAIVLAGALCAVIVNAQTRPGGGFVPPGKVGGGAAGVTSVTAGTGLTGGTITTTGTIAADATYLQRRVSSTCSVSGQFMTAIAADGTPTCTAEPGDISSVVAGTGLTGGATSGAATLNVDTTAIQSRVTGSCTSGNSIRVVNSDGTVTCQAAGAGTVTSVVAGTGLSGGTITTSGTLAVNLTTTSCSAGQAETATAADGTSTCSAFFNTAGTGLTSSGSTVSANLAGGTCGADQYVTAVSSSGAATCGTPIINDYAQTHLEWTDEWLQNQCGNNGVSCGSIWGTVGAGTGITVLGTGTTTRPGVISLTLGSGATNREWLATSPTTVDFGSGNWSLEWVGGLESLADGTNTYAGYVGFGDVTTSINQIDGCGFLIDTQNSATGGANGSKVNNLECYCASNSSRTVYLLAGSGNSDESFALGTVAIGADTLPNTNVLHLLVKMTGSTRAEFYTVSGASQTKVCDINTNIPSGSSRLTGALVGVVSTAGSSNSRAMDVDYTRLAVDLTSARSP